MSSVIDEIKAKLDIVDYIGRYVQLKRVGSRFKCNCPFHVESTPSFIVSPERQHWKCFGACNTGGDIFDFVMKQNSWTMNEAIEALAKDAGIEIKRSENKPLDKLYAILNAACELYQEAIRVEGNPALTHLRGRDLESAIDSPFKIGYTGSGIVSALLKQGYTQKELVSAGILYETERGVVEFICNRLMIPLFDERGRIVGFAGRALNDQQQPKFLNSPKTALFDKSSILYGYAQGKQAIRAMDKVVVVEGYFDVIQAHLAGYTYVVAQMGTELTEAQTKLIGKARTVIALDGDKAGDEATKSSIAQSMKVNKRLFVASLAEGDDPDDVIKRGEWSQLIENKQPALDYMIAVEQAKNPATFTERIEAARSLMALVDIKEQLEANYAAQKIALAFGLPGDALFDKLERVTEYAVVSNNTTEGNLELTCIKGMLKHWSDVFRAFRKIDIPIPNGADFMYYPSFFNRVIEATEQDAVDPVEYVQEHFPVFSDDSELSSRELIHMLLFLRSQNIDLELAEASDAMPLLEQKAKILAYTRY